MKGFLLNKNAKIHALITYVRLMKFSKYSEYEKKIEFDEILWYHNGGSLS